MIFHRIAVSNAGPFLGDWDVVLPEGPTVVVARYEESDVRSNRAGKSYFAVDLPLYVLFGKFRGKSVDDFPHRLARGKEDAFGELEVDSSDGRSWLIRRGRTAGGDPIRELNGSKISDADLVKTVETEILGLSFDEYLNTNAFVQGEMHSFMRMTPAEKRRLVSPWFKTDRWIPRADLAKGRLREAQSELRKLDAREEMAREALEDREEREKEVSAIEAMVKSARGALTRATERRATAKAELDAAVAHRTLRAELRRKFEAERGRAEREIRDAAGAVQNADLAFTRSKEALADARARRDRLTELEGQEEALRALRDNLNALLQSVREAETERGEHSRKREELLRKFKELEKSRTGICPVLREECDRIAADPRVLDALKTEGLAARRAMERAARQAAELQGTVERARREIRASEHAERELLDLRREMSVEEAERNSKAARARFKEAQERLNSLKDGEDDREAAEEELRKRLDVIPDPGEEVELEIAAAVEEEESARGHLSGLEERLADARASLAETDRAADEIEQIEAERVSVRERVRLLAWTSYAFGSAGIPSRELENAFGVAEAEMNEVLEGLNTPLRVFFSPTRELKDWEPACLACGEPFEKGERRHVCRECGTPRRKRRRDELRLEVQDGGNDSSFELDSGGGKVLLSLGGRLGLAALPRAVRRVHCEHLLIDEPDGALDEPNRAALHGLIQRRMKDLGVRQVLLITHADVRREFSSVVQVHRWEDEDRSAVWVD